MAQVDSGDSYERNKKSVAKDKLIQELAMNYKKENLAEFFDKLSLILSSTE